MPPHSSSLIPLIFAFSFAIPFSLPLFLRHISHYFAFMIFFIDFHFLFLFHFDFFFAIDYFHYFHTFHIFSIDYRHAAIAFSATLIRLSSFRRQTVWYAIDAFAPFRFRQLPPPAVISLFAVSTATFIDYIFHFHSTYGWRHIAITPIAGDYFLFSFFSFAGWYADITFSHWYAALIRRQRFSPAD